jgi:Flp pilus assembly protein TadD
LLAAARGESARRPLGPPARFGGVAAAAALGALAFVGLVGNFALSASADAASHHDWKRAAAQARRASDWAPWSSDALDQLGKAQLEQGERAAGVASIRRAIAKDPRHWQLWFDLYNATSGSQAEAAFRRTSQLDPYGAGG